MRVTLYSKPGCQLCEEVLDMLERLTPRYGLQVVEVNIMDDSTLYRAYHAKIPVVEIEGSRLGRVEAPIDVAQLHLHLEIAQRASSANNRIVQPKQESHSTTSRLTGYISRHWLRFVSSALAIFVGLPWLAPVFAALGWWSLADPIYTAYAVT